MKSKLTVIIIALLSTVSIAQTKVGTIDSEYISSIMPEAKIVIKLAQDYGAKLDSSFAIKMNTYQGKIETFKKNEKEMGELAKKTAIKELETLEADIKKYQDNGNKLMQLKQNQLMRPLYKKLGDAINLVAKANGYTQILTTTGNQFVFLDEKYDITQLVMDQLGVKEVDVKE